MKKTCLLLLCILSLCICNAGSRKKTVYVSYILHGNMNYDRYVRPTIWKEFPKIYDGLLDFIDEHPDFKGQLQFSGQTLGSLQQAAPNVLDHAMKIHKRGQLNFTGTFYSEPVNVNMNGETNYRCAWLGTKIVEKFLGEKTDGFYLQERAYHPQLPWILNHADVSWTPIITNDDSWFPFTLKGMDGSTSVCVPITRGDVTERALIAPDRSLLTIEEDYEIPQSFTGSYARVQKFNNENDSIRMEWITVKEYIKRFGIKPEKYIDHSAKAKNRDNGTYSRWTADPLDIITQDYTNKAMHDFRAAQIWCALTGGHLDKPFEAWKGNLPEDPLAWDIEKASLYPDVEPNFLKRNGKVTMLSKAEHLLLWAVNSDAKGWFPLYEKRRERQNSFSSCSYLCRNMIDDGIDQLSSEMKLNGYDRYFMLVNMEAARSKVVKINSATPLELYDLQTGKLLRQYCCRGADASSYSIDFQTELPSYGYQMIGARISDHVDTEKWEEGSSISQGDMTLSVDDYFLKLQQGDDCYEISLEDFEVKALAEVKNGKGDDVWRTLSPHGEPRIAINTQGLYPQLRIDWQIDWLIHLRAMLTLEDGKLICDADFTFPHPTLVGRGGHNDFNFNPEGLDFVIKSGRKCKVGYDIPFGISEYDKSGTAYFCALSSCFMQSDNSGILISPQTGEQAFSVNTDNGTMKVYMGSSTTSGPIRNVGMTFITKTEVNHETAWYFEPFHGTYHHRLILVPYKGKWQDAHLPRKMEAVSAPVYLRECWAKGNGSRPFTQSFAECDNEGCEVTMMEMVDGKLKYRINEREGNNTIYTLTIGEKTFKNKILPFQIIGN